MKTLYLIRPCLTSTIVSTLLGTPHSTIMKALSAQWSSVKTIKANKEKPLLQVQEAAGVASRLQTAIDVGSSADDSSDHGDGILAGRASHLSPAAEERGMDGKHRRCSDGGTPQSPGEERLLEARVRATPEAQVARRLDLDPGLIRTPYTGEYELVSSPDDL